MGKIKVEVSYLPGVEDPEAITLTKNLRVLGYKTVKSVKISKVYEFDLAGREGREQVHEIAKKLLCNEVIQDFHVKE